MSSESGEIEVEAVSGYQILPKDVVAEIGSIKLFNKWSYEDVEIRDISLTYVPDHLSASGIFFGKGHRMDRHGLWEGQINRPSVQCRRSARLFFFCTQDSRLGEDHAFPPPPAQLDILCPDRIYVGSEQMANNVPPMMQRLHPDPLPRLPASLRWPICRQALPQGQLPHH